jgi:hypothetical protein
MMRHNQGFEMNWIPMKCKWPGKCEACESSTYKGDSIYWNKTTKKVRHQKCLDGEFYETMNQKQYWKGRY